MHFMTHSVMRASSLAPSRGHAVQECNSSHMRSNTMRINLVTGILTGALALGLMSCGSDNGGTNPTIDAPPQVSGTYYHYVTNEVAVTPAAEVGFDLTGDSVVDNKVGNVLALAGAAGLNVGNVLNEGISRGVFVLLHSVRANSLTSG